MRLHIVGGFLGSGKTTAIIGAAKTLMARGKRVGVVTNDQGRYLVDTAFFQSSLVPAVEVTGGCFCCNYDDLDAQLAQLKATAHPDVIFAESVGSCADIVATVVKPLLTLGADASMGPTSFSVFADARLLRRRLLDLPMPFSDNVVYLFDKQIEEAGLLIVNKRDLLAVEDAHALQALTASRFPDKPVRLQNSLEATEIEGWLSDLASGLATPPAAVLDIDYDRYGAGEAMLAWVDETLHFSVPSGKGRGVVLRLMQAILDRIERSRLTIGHLKFMVTAGPVNAKVSFLTVGGLGWESQIPTLPGSQVTLLLNARVEAAASDLRDLVAEAVEAAVTDTNVTYEMANVSFFHPGFPNPTHRIQ
ncbi:MAG: hypothetical protein JXC32_19195 [Anaerolineae bacterium]|nr:hypothetical protein [Anaerolineae bacterium]